MSENNLVKTNIISKKPTRFFQKETFKTVADKIISSAGPKGSLTKIISPLSKTEDGANLQVPVSTYTKDGQTILEHMSCSDTGLVCNSVIFDALDMTTYIKKRVGDGSTAGVCMASRIFNNLCDIEDETNLPPREIAKKFKEAVKIISDKILEDKKEFTAKEAYNIAYISSNGDENMANNISSMYDKLGNGVVIDIATSPDEEDHLKVVDGMSFDRGYNNPAYKNDPKGSNKCILNNPRIYYFRSSLETPEQIELFSAIINENVFYKYRKETNPSGEEPIPTLILAPHLGGDVAPVISSTIRMIQQFDKPELIGKKPPICIVSNLAPDSAEQVDDIMRLCDAPIIRTYNSKERQTDDQNKGIAPTPETVADCFFGTAEQVIVDPVSTKFISPKLQYTTVGEKRKLECQVNNVDYIPSEGDDEVVLSAAYEGLISGLKDQYDLEKNAGSDLHVLGNLDRRINSLKSSFVEYQVGGITTTDRDADISFLRDAVKNCASAAKDGVGYACNMEGYFTTKELLEQDEYKDNKFIKLIFDAYTDYISELYKLSFGIDKEKALKLLSWNNREEGIVDLAQGIVDDTKVAISPCIQSSIESDPVVLTAISKIVTLMIMTVQTSIISSLYDVYTDATPDNE